MTSDQEDMNDNSNNGGVNNILLPERVPEEWDVCQIQDMLERVSNRVDPDKMETQDYISLKHMGKGEPRVKECGTSDEVSSKKYRFSEGDILFGKLRPYFRKVAISKTKGVCSTDINVINPTEKVDRDFLFYTLFREKFIDISDKTSTGTRMPRADWSKLEKLKVALPPSSEQKKISRILYAIDQKIETNYKINQTIEKISDSLFNSWFVTFEPYKKFKDSELGQIPKSFNIIELSELLSLEYGKGLSKDDREGDKYPVYGSNGINGSHSEFLVEGPGVIVGRKGTIGTVNYEPRDFWCIDTTFYVEPKREYDMIFYYHLLKNGVRLKHLGSDSAVPGLNRNTVHDQKVAIPKEERVKQFIQLVKPMYKIKERKKRENKYLSELRETLLPKLMSGEIRVNDIELDELEVDSEV